MTEEIKRIDIKEFRALGFLQELNRTFLHPLGLALGVIIDENTEEESLGGVWDYRNDPEGMFFADGVINLKKVEKIKELRHSKIKTRVSNKYNVEVDENGIQVK